MITKTKTKKINLFNFKSSHINKQILIEMAKNGEKKPSLNTKLGRALKSYTKKHTGVYDKEFDKQIRKLRPDWFISQLENSDKNKKTLIRMAKKGENRPKSSTFIGRRLSAFTCKSHTSYSENFSKLIKKIRPDWFLTTQEKANIRKQKLIEMAKNGKKRPDSKTSLGMSLVKYTSENSNGYDKEFTKTIRKLRPDWFNRNRKDWFGENKRKLIEMAKNGEDKPKYGTIIRKSLYLYTSKNSKSYDVVFDKIIRKLRPDWFKCKKKSDIDNEK